MGGTTLPREYKILDGVFYQKCNTCGRWLTKDKFTKSKSKKFGIRTRCYDCNKPMQRKRHQNWYNNNKERSNESCRIYQIENRIKRNLARDEYEKTFQEKYGFSCSKFHHKTRNYVRTHNLKPKLCPICGRDGNIQIHHPSYESFDKWMVVVFCCQYCHRAIHDGYIECPEPIQLMECQSHA